MQILVACLLVFLGRGRHFFSMHYSLTRRLGGVSQSSRINYDYTVLYLVLLVQYVCNLRLRVLYVRPVVCLYSTVHVYGVPSKYESKWKLGNASTHAGFSQEREQTAL